MLPVTRANLDYICSVCLIDIRPPLHTKKVYDVSDEKDFCKMLKLTAYIVVLKNPMKQTLIDKYCRKICELCYVKTEYAFNFREKILASTIVLKEILENEDIDDEEIKKLQSFCRICLNRQNCTQEPPLLTMKFLKWLKDCSGLRFTSLIENEVFRLKEGTNITELMVVQDAYFPKQLCQRCFKNLRIAEEFRQQATQSFEYMISIMGDDEKLPTANTRHVDINAENDKLLKAQDKNMSETEDYLQKDIKIDMEQFMFQELKVSSPDIELYNMNESRDYSSDDDRSFEANFLDNDTTFTEIKTEEITQDDNSFERDPIEDFNAITTKYSEQDKKDFKKEYHSDLDFNDSDDNTILSHLLNANAKQKRTKRTAKAKQRKKIDKNTDQQPNTIKSESIEIDNQAELLSDNQSNHQNTEKSIPQISKESTKKSKKTKSTRKKLTDCHVDQCHNCDQCSKSFRTPYILKRHIKDMHSIVEENVCPICSTTFRRKHHLLGHIRTVHEKIKPHKCSYCDRAFATPSIKRVHELCHSDTYPFVCDWCARRFRTTSQLKIHLEVHTTKPELLCHICKRAQLTVETLQEHLKTHDEKRLQCPSCGKFFKNKSHLRDHQNAVHLKLRPFKCKFCDLGFGDRKTRRVHEYSHTEDRPEKCSVCNRGFKCRSSLGRHIKVSGHMAVF